MLLALSADDAVTAVDMITGPDLDCQVICSRGAAMILLAEVTKATRLLAALAELGLSAHNTIATIAVGDAENDLSLLRAAEAEAAVVSAVPSLDTGAGQELPGLLAERWIEARYAELAIDPEGDHAGLAERPGVLLVNAAARLPSPTCLLASVRSGHASLVLDLSALPEAENSAYLRRLSAAADAGRPATRIIRGSPEAALIASIAPSAR